MSAGAGYSRADWPGGKPPGLTWMAIAQMDVGSWSHGAVQFVGVIPWGAHSNIDTIDMYQTTIDQRAA